MALSEVRTSESELNFSRGLLTIVKKVKFRINMWRQEK